jgi:hypothetical protein
MVTLNPLAWSNLPREAEMIPLPNEEVTPPVTKIYLVVAKINYSFKIHIYIHAQMDEPEPEQSDNKNFTRCPNHQSFLFFQTKPQFYV